jgi:hypothetical protein
MKTLLKKFAWVLGFVMILGVVFIGQAFAQTQSSDEVFEVYVENITLNASDFKPGDTVRGQFTLFNNTNKVVSNVFYDVRLGSDYDESGLPGNFYATESFGPISLAPGEKRIMEFSHKLPVNISGQVGLRVKAYLQSGNPLGFADSRFVISGQTKAVSIDKNYIKVKNRTFSLGEGPTLSSGVTGQLYASVIVPAGFKSLTPKIAIFDRSVYGDIMTETALPSINLASVATTSTIVFDLPKFENNAGVYVGMLKIYDEASNQVSPDVTFRYIVSGDILTINSVSSDQLSVGREAPFAITLNYSGSPENIVERTTSAVKEYDLTVKVSNEDGDAVASYYGKISDPGASAVASYKFIALASAKTLSVSVVVKSADQVLANYNTSLPVEACDVELSLIVSVFVLAILAILIIVLRRKKRVLAIASIVLFMGLSFAVNTVSAWSDVSTSGVHPPNISPNNSPVENGNYSPSQTISLSGTVYQDACSNNKRWIHIDVSPTCNGVYTEVWSKTRGDDGRDDRWGAWEYATNFTAPATPGSYNVCVKVRSYEDIGSNVKPKDPQGVRVRKQPYNVAAPVTNGACGSAASTDSLNAPTANLCAAGTATAVSSTTNSWTWSCNGTGTGATNATCSATKAASLYAECSASPSSGRAPLPVVWSVNTSGGSGAFTYNWSGTDGLSGNTATVSKTYAEKGTKNATVVVVRGSETRTVNCPGSVGGSGGGGGGSTGGNGIVVSEPGPLSVNCVSNPPSINSGESVVWIAYPSGGTPPYTSYIWSGAANGSSNQTSAFDYSVGPQTASVTVTDSASATESASCRLSVNPPAPTPLSCRVVRVYSELNNNKVAVNTNTQWKVVNSTGDDISGGYARAWEVREGNGNYTPAGGATILDKIFTTVGLKTVKATLSSTTETGYVTYECELGATATTSVVLPGDLTEI